VVEAVADTPRLTWTDPEKVESDLEDGRIGLGYPMLAGDDNGSDVPADAEGIDLVTLHVRRSVGDETKPDSARRGVVQEALDVRVQPEGGLRQAAVLAEGELQS
jgi:hypothetical protein